MLSLTYIPEGRIFAGNPIAFALQTDNHVVTEGQYPSFYLMISTGQTPAAGNSLILDFDGRSELFTFVNGTPGNVNELSAYSGGTITSYLNTLVAQLGSHPIISARFSLFVYTAGYFFLGIARKENLPLDGASNTGGWFVLTDNTVVLPVYRENFSIELQLYVEQTWRGNDYELAATLRHGVNKDGETSFDIANLLRAYLGADAPDTRLFRVCTETQRQYALQVYERYGSPSAIQQATLLRYSGYAIKAGMPDSSYFSTYNAIIPADPDKNKFLTLWPDSKRVTADQPEWLVFRKDEALITRVNVICHYTDGSFQGGLVVSTTTMATAKLNDLVMIAVGHDQLNLGARQPSKTMVYYEVQLLKSTAPGSTTPIYKTRKYYLVHKEFEFKRFLVFQNSVGGVDTVRCTGRQSLAMSASSTPIEQGWTYADNLPTHRRREVNTLRNKQYAISTGYVDEATAYYMEELLGAEYAWLWHENGADSLALPIRIVRQDAPVANDDGDLYSVAFTYTKAYRDEGVENLTDYNELIE